MKTFNLSIDRLAARSVHEFLLGQGLKSTHWPGDEFDARCAGAAAKLDTGRIWTQAREAIASFDAFSDAPYNFLYREALKTVADAKFILMMRDAQQWIALMRGIYGDRPLRSLDRLQFWLNAKEKRERVSEYSDNDLEAIYYAHLSRVSDAMLLHNAAFRVFSLHDPHIGKSIGAFLGFEASGIFPFYEVPNDAVADTAVASVFETYELLKRSKLFDPAFYLTHFSDVASRNVDPLLHYIEYGAREGRDPSERFQVAHYLEQCAKYGERPVNPLFHFLTVGAARGLTSLPAAILAPLLKEEPTAATMRMHIDLPRIVGGVAGTTVRTSLAITGWALARKGVASIEIWLDGKRVARAHYGIRRDDVRDAFPNWNDNLLSGFAAVLSRSLLTEGSHEVVVKLIDGASHAESVTFAVNVQNLAENEGPGQLRRKMSQTEIRLQERVLLAIGWRPSFRLLLILEENEAFFDAALATVATLHEQAYAQWRLQVMASSEKMASRFRARIVRKFGHADERVDVGAWPDTVPLAQIAAPKGELGEPTLIGILDAGDALGCDALLEFAIATGLEPEADFFYSDERCLSPSSRSVEPFFKPDWSPDLLLSTNYIGRMWCARPPLLAAVGATIAELRRRGEYDLILRCTEVATGIHHLPAVLCDHHNVADADRTSQRRALERAAKRRGIEAEILSGCAPGIFRLRRHAPSDLVSIIIPTCGERELVKTCIESIRRRTAHKNIEIICIENMPKGNNVLRKWLRDHADGVISTQEPFNWSRYNNLCVAKARGKFLLFLNDDMEIIDGNWLTALLEHGARPEVGAVGAQLLYPDRTVQHAGVVLNALGRARHAFRHAREDDPCYFGLALTQRNVIGVTGACILTRRDLFDRLGGFNEAHRVVNNDLDYCLRVWRDGLKIIFTPYAKLIHHEQASRTTIGDEYDLGHFEREWLALFLHGDPYFNPNLSNDEDHFVAERETTRYIYPGNPVLPDRPFAKILVVKLDHIGDCILALPAIHRLKALFPQAKSYVLAAPGTKTIWAGETWVEEVIEFDFFHAQSGAGRKNVSTDQYERLRARLAPYRFDLAIDLRKHPDTRPILRDTGARFTAGFDYQNQFPWLDFALEWEGNPPLVRKRGHVSDDLMNLVALVANASAPAPARESSQGAMPKKVAAVAKAMFRRRVIAIHPGAGTVMRQWPPEYFAELIDLLIEEEDVHIALIGTEAERAIVKVLTKRVRRGASVWDFVGKIGLAELPGLLTRCALFIGNNSGPKHLAASLGVPTIGISSGVVDAHEWGPVGPAAIAVTREMDCAPCYLIRPEDCLRGLACLKGLRPGEIHRVSKRLLALHAPVLDQASSASKPASPRRASSVSAAPTPAAAARRKQAKASSLSSGSPRPTS